MTQVTFRFPSSMTYAYTEVTGTPEEIEQIDPEALGMLFMNAMHAYGLAEARARDLISNPPTEAPPGDPAAATKRLAEGKKPRTVDEGNEMAKQVIEEALGATEVADDVAPYKQPPPAAKARPWAKKTSATTAAKIEEFGF